MWKLIQPILDPVVAAKVHFLNGAQALEQLIPQNRILKELGGAEDWEYEYIEPKADENDKLQTRPRETPFLQTERSWRMIFSASRLSGFQGRKLMRP